VRRGIHRRQLALATGVVVLLARHSSAQDIWTAGTGDWFNAGNWSGRVPNSGLAALIDNGGTAQIISGSNAATAGIYLGKNAGDSGSLLLSAGTLTGGDEVGFNGTGYITQTGGTNDAGSFLELGVNAGSTGSYTLSAGTLSAGEIIGNSGEGTFAQSGGTNTYATGQFDLGEYPKGNGTYLLSGGTLENGPVFGGEIHVGLQGTGTFVQTGGMLFFVAYLEVAYGYGGANAQGTYLLSGGTITFAPQFSGEPGYERIGGDGTGSFTQSGGFNSTPNLQIEPTGNYSLSGGTLSVTQEYIGYNGVGSFTLTGGVNNVSGGFMVGDEGLLDFGIAGATRGSDYGVLSIAGAATLGGELDVALCNGFSPTIGQSFGHSDRRLNQRRLHHHQPPRRRRIVQSRRFVQQQFLRPDVFIHAGHRHCRAGPGRLCSARSRSRRNLGATTPGRTPHHQTLTIIAGSWALSPHSPTQLVANLISISGWASSHSLIFSSIRRIPSSLRRPWKLRTRTAPVPNTWAGRLNSRSGAVPGTTILNLPSVLDSE